MLLFGICVLIVDILAFIGYMLLFSVPFNFFIPQFSMALLVVLIVAALAISAIIEKFSTTTKCSAVTVLYSSTIASFTTWSIPIIYLVVILIMLITNGGLGGSAKRYEYASSLVTEVTGEGVFPVIDMKQLPLNDEIEAMKNSETLMGKYPGLGSRFEIKLKDFTSQVVEGQLVYVAPIQPQSMMKWQKETGTPGYFVVNRNTGVTEFIEEPSFYVQDAPFTRKVERVFRNFDRISGFTEITTQLNSEKELKYVTTTYSVGGYGGIKTATGVLVMDAKTGQIDRYELNNLPEWINRVYPMEFFQDYLLDYGLYSHGWLNSRIQKLDVMKATDGYGVLYSEGQCYYYTGLTSEGRDEAVNAIVRMNARTGEITLYSSFGISETKAMGIADGRMQEAGYKAGYPLLVKVGGHETYFLKMRDEANNIVGYAFVNFKDYTKAGVAKDLFEAQAEYLKEIQSSISTDILTESEMVTLSAKIIQTEMAVIEGNSYVYLQLENNKTIFSMDVKMDPTVLFLKPETTVKVTYLPTEEEIVNILSIKH